MTFELSESEIEVLETLLSRFIGETNSEIYRTETASYKDDLKRQMQAAKDLLAKITGKAVTG